MTIDDILKGVIPDTDSIEELSELIFSLHSVTLSNDNVDNIIEFLKYCKTIPPNRQHDMKDYVIWYFLYILDSLDHDNYEFYKKITNVFRDEFEDIRKNVLIKPKSGIEIPRDVWHYGWTKLPFDEVKIKYT